MGSSQFANHAVGSKRFRRLCKALGWDTSNETYNRLCDEFKVGYGFSLHNELGKDEYAWVDSPHVLALYKAKKWRQDEPE
jgi:hypothetical protein